MLPITMSGLRAAQKELGVTSNNLANASTVGFKRSDANFVDMFPNDPSANPRTSVGSGTAVDLVSRDTSQGAMKSTGRITDLAIAGRGYFVLKSPQPEDGSAPATFFTRAGGFNVDSSGRMLDSSGNRVQGFEVTDEGVSTELSDLTIPPKVPSVKADDTPTESMLQTISISPKGYVQATYSDNSQRNIGYIALANFSNDMALRPVGNTDFALTGESGEPVITQAGSPQAGDIMSGTLEQANVDITQELMTMLRAQQVYNGNARMLQTEVEIASRIVDKL
jgi:flagellar hook protein FlgE